MLSRREILRRVIAAASVPPLGALGACVARREVDAQAHPEPAEAHAMHTNRVSLAQWSLHRFIKDGGLDPMDFPRYARERFGLRGVEYVSHFYKPQPVSGEWALELRRRADDEGVQSILIMVDGEGTLGSPNALERQKSVQAHQRWLDAAAVLGCHSIRVNAHSEGDATVQRDLCADGISSLCERAAPLGLSVIIENHGGLSCDGEWVASVVRTVGLPNCGTLPDFGNFKCLDGTMADRYAGVAAMIPTARGVSAKSYDFDAQGEETTIDFARMLGIVRTGGYRGWIGIEYEGKRLTEPEGIEATRALLIRLGCVAS